MPRRLLTNAWVLLLICGPALADEPAKTEADKPAAPTREELEKQFAADMNDVTLVGRYTSGGGDSAKQERYSIYEVSKVKGDTWLFKTRILYGEHDVTVPIPLDVKWAGDTPVITLTDMSIPGLGTYTARVLIFRGQYVGVWSGGNHGGQLSGRIEKNVNNQKPGDEKPAATK